MMITKNRDSIYKRSITLEPCFGKRFPKGVNYKIFARMKCDAATKIENELRRTIKWRHVTKLRRTTVDGFSTIWIQFIIFTKTKKKPSNVNNFCNHMYTTQSFEGQCNKKIYNSNLCTEDTSNLMCGTNNNYAHNKLINRLISNNRNKKCKIFMQK